MQEQGVTLQENILKEAPHLHKKSHRLPNVSRRIFQSKRRILRSPIASELPAGTRWMD